MDMPAFERDAEHFCRAVGRESYLQRAGLKDSLELSPIYDRSRHLFSIESYEALDEAELEPKDKRFLRAFVAGHFLHAQVKRRSEHLAQAEATTTIAWEGEQISYRAAPVRWANLATQERRHALNERWREATAGMNRVRRERHRASVGLAPELGGVDYVQLWDQLHGLHLETLSRQAGDLLEATGELYRTELSDQLAHAKVPAGDAWKADLGWVFRAPQFDPYFSTERLMPSLRVTLADLGLRLEDQSNIKLDTAYRPRKSPRAFCAPIEIPDDVRLVLMPSGGRTDYEMLLHEAGHAEHFGNVDRTQPFAYRRLGDVSVTEAYAFLFEYLTTDRHWLTSHVDFTSATDYLRLSLFNKLYMLRRYCTKVMYEQRLHRAPDDEDLPELYAELFTQHLGVRYFADEYLFDVDDAFYAAQYLRAWMLEAQLRLFLKREFDEEWFRAPRAGRFLLELWREGQKYTAEELAGFMGYAGLDSAPMLDEIRAAFQS